MSMEAGLSATSNGLPRGDTPSTENEVHSRVLRLPRRLPQKLRYSASSSCSIELRNSSFAPTPPKTNAKRDVAQLLCPRLGFFRLGYATQWPAMESRRKTFSLRVRQPSSHPPDSMAKKLLTAVRANCRRYWSRGSVCTSVTVSALLEVGFAYLKPRTGLPLMRASRDEFT